LITELIIKTSTNYQDLESVSQLDPELKCIIVECYRALDKIEETEEQNYLTPKIIKEFVMKKKRGEQGDKENKV